MSNKKNNQQSINPIIETMIGLISSQMTKNLLNEGIQPTSEHHLAIKHAVLNMYQKIETSKETDKESIALTFLGDLQKVPDLQNNNPNQTMENLYKLIDELEKVSGQMKNLGNQEKKEVARMAERANQANQGGLNLN